MMDESLPIMNSQCVVDITGMRCQNCVRNIEKTIGSKQGIISIKVDLEAKEGAVCYDSSIVDPSQVAEYIVAMGFKANLKNESLPNDAKSVAVEETVVEIDLLDKEEPPSVSKSEDRKCFIQIRGMTCASCVSAIEKHAKKINGKFYIFHIFICITILFFSGVTNILVALMAGKAEVFYDMNKTSAQAVCDSITNLGFPSSILSSEMKISKSGEETTDGSATVEVHISGMTCASCVYKIESNMSKIDGVLEARVALTTQKGRFCYDVDRIGPRQIIDHINVRFVGSGRKGICLFDQRLLFLRIWASKPPWRWERNDQ
jgi:P-type Cu+ transporter